MPWGISLILPIVIYNCATTNQKFTHLQLECRQNVNADKTKDKIKELRYEGKTLQGNKKIPRFSPTNLGRAKPKISGNPSCGLAVVVAGSTDITQYILLVLTQNDLQG